MKRNGILPSPLPFISRHLLRWCQFNSKGHTTYVHGCLPGHPLIRIWDAFCAEGYKTIQQTLWRIDKNGNLRNHMHGQRLLTRIFANCMPFSVLHPPCLSPSPPVRYGGWESRYSSSKSCSLCNRSENRNYNVVNWYCWHFPPHLPYNPIFHF